MWSGPRSLSADRRGSTPQHLAPLQDAARFPASPSAAEIQEYNHHLPQEDQRRLHHRAELRQPPDIEALPLQRGTGGRWQTMADAVRAGQADRCQRKHKSCLFPVWFLVCSSPRLATLICCGFLLDWWSLSQAVCRKPPCCDVVTWGRSVWCVYYPSG